MALKPLAGKAGLTGLGSVELKPRPSSFHLFSSRRRRRRRRRRRWRLRPTGERSLAARDGLVLRVDRMLAASRAVDVKRGRVGLLAAADAAVAAGQLGQGHDGREVRFWNTFD